MTDLILKKTNEQIASINLTSEYSASQYYKKNFNEYIDSLFTIVNNEDNKTLFSPSNQFQITMKLYREIESSILEKHEDDVQDDFIEKLDDLEFVLRDSIVKNLGSFYENTPEMNDLIDYSTNGFIMANRFSLTALTKHIVNPWDSSKSILVDNGLLHSFYNDKSYLRSLGIKESNTDSEEIEGNKITIVGKGRKKTFSHGTVRDIFGLRGHVYNLIKEKAPNSTKSIKSDNLIKILRSQGVTENQMSDIQIKNWLINPLKRIGKIGSCVEGYFNLETCTDLHKTYKSHLENFRGYLHSLENYRIISEKNQCFSNLTDNPFEEHLDIMKRFINPE